MGFVDPDFAEIGTPLSVEVIGEAVAACVVDPCLHDPQNELMRA